MTQYGVQDDARLSLNPVITSTCLSNVELDPSIHDQPSHDILVPRSYHGVFALDL